MAQRYQGGILGVGFNPLQAPNAPTIGAASAGGGQVSVAFTAPANVGGSAVSSYAVRVSPGNFSATGSASPITVSGLSNGTTYTFSVAALNSYGPSPYSGTVTATPGLFVEDVFSTYLYTGNGTSQTITNGINLSGQGGLVWTKRRVNTTYGDTYHILTDTIRGANKQLYSNGTDAQATNSNMITSFNADGYSIGSDGNVNFSGSGQTYVSWTFREAPKFFDIVTWTGNGASGFQTYNHNLGVTPGCILVKPVSASGSWYVYHVGIGDTKALRLELTNAAISVDPGQTGWSVSPTTFGINATQLGQNTNGVQYVAYLFAHDTASDGIIQCGSYSGTGAAGNAQNLGWEPQWLMVKSASGVGDWFMLDNMRGIPTGGNDACLLANSSIAEFANADRINLTSTGFEFGGSDLNNSGTSYIYVAIRRGPMRTPTVGTSVFAPTQSSNNAPWYKPGFPVDLGIGFTTTGSDMWFSDRLRGQFLNNPYNTNPESVASTGKFDYMNGWHTNSSLISTYYAWNFRRAPSFFDEVCYTGTGVARTVNHNLGVAPELMIVKSRSITAGWIVQCPAMGSATADYLFVNNANAKNSLANIWQSPTATTFGIGSAAPTEPSFNQNNATYVAYLFASCPGVSKVGTYTGTGALQTINCGFTTGARFVLIKRTDGTGGWHVWDSLRGISSFADPFMLLNSTAAEVTGTNYVDTDTTGFKVTAAAPAALNANGGTYIFLAIS